MCCREKGGPMGQWGLQQRTRKDKAALVATGAHFLLRLGTMCEASLPYPTIPYCETTAVNVSECARLTAGAL